MDNRSKGVLAILVSALGFSLMNLLIPLAGDLPTIQKSFFRNLIALLVAVYVMVRQNKVSPIKELQNLRHVPWGILTLRALVGTLGMWCNFYAVDHLYISDASVLNKLSPFAILIFSHFFLKERLKRLHLLILSLAFIGVIFVVKPTLATQDLFPYLIGIMGGVLAGAAYTFVRKLNTMGVTPAFIVFFFSLFSCLMSLPQMIFDFKPMSGVSILILLGVGLMASVGQFGITLAYRFAPAYEISVYDYTSIIFSGIWGFVFLNQIPDRWSIIGYVVIMGAGILSFYYHRYQIRSKQ